MKVYFYVNFSINFVKKAKVFLKCADIRNIRKHIWEIYMENFKNHKGEGQESGVSIYSRSINLLDDDPLEEIFALNLGDFLTEHLINPELAHKIGDKVRDKNESLKEQLRELVSIYSIDNTLSLLGFKNDEDYVIYNSIAKTIKTLINIEPEVIIEITITGIIANGVPKYGIKFINPAKIAKATPYGKPIRM